MCLNDYDFEKLNKEIKTVQEIKRKQTKADWYQQRKNNLTEEQKDVLTKKNTESHKKRRAEMPHEKKKDY